ncbi:hypothetical protein AB0C65_35810 [Nocardia sp. NPDC048505]|uniref:hypothetical protein n=1 Tax=Nocardia sp. NPDC048505 TaxID=3155756 RepID=UPI0033F362D0
MAATALDMTGPRPHAASPVYAVYGHLDPHALTLAEARERGALHRQIPTDVLMALETGQPRLAEQALAHLRAARTQPLLGAVGFDDWWNTALGVLNPDWALAPARRLVTDKARLYETLRAGGVAVPAFRTGSLSATLLRFAVDNLGPRPVFKPATGAGSRGVYRYRADLDTEENLALYQQILRAGHIDTATPILATQYLGEHDAAVEISVELIISAGRATHAVVHEKCTATAVPPFLDAVMVCPPTDERIIAALAQLPSLLDGIVAALELANAVLHIEARLHLRRWHVLDIGVRPGAGLVAHAALAHTGIDPRLAHSAASIGLPLAPESLETARGAHPATAIACCYITPDHRDTVRLARHGELADTLADAGDVLGWHLNVAETRDAVYRPDAGISVGVGAGEVAVALSRLRSLVAPYEFATPTRVNTETVAAQ